MDLLIQLASPILTAVMAVGGAYIAFNNRLTILETKNDDVPQSSETSDLSEVKTEIAVINAEIKALTDEVRKHNNVIERTYKLEARVDSLERRI